MIPRPNSARTEGTGPAAHDPLDLPPLDAEVVSFDDALNPGVQAPSYEEVTGYPAPGRTWIAGVAFRAGR